MVTITIRSVFQVIGFRPGSSVLKNCFSNTRNKGLSAKREMANHADFLCGREWEFTPLGSAFFRSPKSFDGCEFSLMSYNILAQNLLEDNRELYRNVDYRSLEWDHRRYRLLLELRFYNPHVVCMQEMNQEHLNGDLLEIFSSMGYSIVYQPRTGDKKDGCLIMFKRKHFKLLIERKVKFFRKGVTNLDRDNVGVVVLLSPVSRPDLKVCIATTHLLFNPRRGEIKLSQLALLIAEINSIVSKNGSSGDVAGDGTGCPCIVCGDFNSIPFSPLYNFITQGALDYTKFSGPQISAQETNNSSHSYHSQRYLSLPTLGAPLLPGVVGLQDNCQYAGENEDDDGCCVVRPMGPVLSHRLQLSSVYSHLSIKYPNTPELTSFHERSEETLDYIFYTKASPRHQPMDFGNGGRNESRLIPLCRLGLLTKNELKSRGGLPNRLQPSDHLPLMCSFLLSNSPNP
ncbi:protein angel homolog 2-like [Convolutriloba macropyga]|uniref:protein angel homolog 2-like n=1 Tax=Convolutriloba macropyga TaxID=536237 RepID=UPI003F5208BA